VKLVDFQRLITLVLIDFTNFFGFVCLMKFGIWASSRWTR